MLVNGVDTSALTPDDCTAFPAEVVGRVLQLDGDAACYKVTYDDSESIDSCIRNFFDSVEYRRKMSGSTYVNIHLTGSNKGGRYKQATVKKYQGNRDGKVKPDNLLKLRLYLIQLSDSDYNVILHENQEADDGMAQANYKAIQDDERHLSIIMSEDKDLCMCSGLHCNWNTFEIIDVDGFGSIYLDESGSTKKIKGYGTSFFWAQMLMGDTADNIPGCEKIGAELLEVFDPLKKPNHKRKPKKCGAVLAYKLLKDIEDDLTAMHRVLSCYRSCYSEIDSHGREYPYEYTAWDGTEMSRKAVEMMLEQAQLLWMRRVPDEDPRHFFKDVSMQRKWDGSLLG